MQPFSCWGHRWLRLGHKNLDLNLANVFIRRKIGNWFCAHHHHLPQHLHDHRRQSSSASGTPSAGPGLAFQSASVSNRCSKRFTCLPAFSRIASFVFSWSPVHRMEATQAYVLERVLGMTYWKALPVAWHYFTICTSILLSLWHIALEQIVYFIHIHTQSHKIGL